MQLVPKNGEIFLIYGQSLYKNIWAEIFSRANLFPVKVLSRKCLISDMIGWLIVREVFVRGIPVWKIDYII